ncbi:MAG TPA: DUF2232 domain-containing protein [Methylococcaceae bacterium]|nr:DUF2232 domain-containing protein [Methylococcaceae bacterium]
MREFAEFVMRSRFHAMALAGFFGALSLSLLPLAFLSAGIVGLVALRRGWRDGLFVSVGASILVAAGWFLVQSRPGLGFPVVLALWLLVLLSAEALRRSESQGIALMIVASAGALFVIIMHALVGDVVAFWEAWLRRAVTGVPGATVQGFERDGTLRLMNGLIALLFGTSAMFSLLIARWWQSLLYHPGGFAPEFCRLRLPRMVLPGVVALLLVSGYFSQGLLVDLFLICVMMYFFVGLAVIHGVVARRRVPWGWAIPPYIALAFLPHYALVGMAFLGALDSFFDFRGRAARP